MKEGIESNRNIIGTIKEETGMHVSDPMQGNEFRKDGSLMSTYSDKDGVWEILSAEPTGKEDTDELENGDTLYSREYKVKMRLIEVK